MFHAVTKAALVPIPALAFALAVGFLVLYIALIILSLDILIGDKSAAGDEIEEVLVTFLAGESLLR